MVASTCQRHQDQLKSCQEQVTTPTQKLSGTVPSDLLAIPTTVLSTAANLQTSISTVPCYYPQRICQPPTKYNSDPYS